MHLIRDLGFFWSGNLEPAVVKVWKFLLFLLEIVDYCGCGWVFHNCALYFLLVILYFIRNELVYDFLYAGNRLFIGFALAKGLKKQGKETAYISRYIICFSQITTHRARFWGWNLKVQITEKEEQMQS